MEALAAVLDLLSYWFTVHESLLSALAASLVIGGVVMSIGYRTVARTGAIIRRPQSDGPALNEVQRVRFATAADGARIAWVRTGAHGGGVPLVRALGWFTHLEAEWSCAEGRALWAGFGRRHPLYRYDGRGMGLSARGEFEFSLEERVRDLEAVVDAAGLERFALMGLSEGGCTAMAYAARHPERVSHLVLYGTFLGTRNLDPVARRRWQALLPVIEAGWGADSPVCRQLFTSIMIPDADQAQNRYFNELQRAACSGTTASQVMMATAAIDVARAAGQITAPTLVLHRQGDLAVPVEEAGRVAGAIRYAELALLPGANHWMLMREPDTDDVLKRVEDFLVRHPEALPAPRRQVPRRLS
jgi:pimeloyl-ACP methyl ester carboxylesterase